MGLGFKETQLGYLPETWKIDTMENALENIIDYRGKTPKKSEKGILTLSAKSVKTGFIDYTKAYFISSETYQKFMVRGIPKTGDILMTTEAPLGCIAKLDRDDVGIAQRLLTLRGKKEYLLNDYLMYYLMSTSGQHQLKLRASGTTVIGIKQSEFRKVLIAIPPISEQKAIASILSSLDDKIELNNQINKNLEEMAQAIFKHWFIEFEFPNENGEPYKSSGGEMIESELGLIPKGWEVKELGEVLSFNPSRQLRRGDESPYLDMKNMPTSGHHPDYWWNREFRGGSRFINGDILIARITPCLENGKTAFVDFLKEGQVGWGSTEFIVMRPVNRDFPAEFIYYLARDETFRAYATANMVGSSGRQRVPIDSLKEYNIAIPPNELLANFHDIAHNVMTKVKLNHVEIQILSSIRDTLLPKLMSGEIRVPLEK